MAEPPEHPWRPRPTHSEDREAVEALWAIASELREMNERQQ